MLAVDFSAKIIQSGDLQISIKQPLEFLLLKSYSFSAVVAGILV
jgi:hypothetical protein